MIPTEPELEWFRDLVQQELSEDHGSFTVTATLDKENRKLTYKKSYADGKEFSVTLNVDENYQPLLPVFDYKREREKRQLKRVLLIGFVSLIWALTFLAVSFALRILRGSIA